MLYQCPNIDHTYNDLSLWNIQESCQEVVYRNFYKSTFGMEHSQALQSLTEHPCLLLRPIQDKPLTPLNRNKKQNSHGEMNYQLKINVIYLNHIFGDVQKLDHFLMEQVI